MRLAEEEWPSFLLLSFQPSKIEAAEEKSIDLARRRTRRSIVRRREAGRRQAAGRRPRMRNEPEKDAGVAASNEGKGQKTHSNANKKRKQKLRQRSVEMPAP